MSFFNTVRIAFRALLKNKMRAALTVLGIVIGIAAVTAMVSLGLSLSQLVQGEFENLGTNVIFITPGNSEGRGPQRGLVPTLTAGDAEAIVEECPSVLAATPMVFAAGSQAIYGNNNCNPAQLFGVGAEYATVRAWQVRLGTFFSDQDSRSVNKICVIGQTIVEELFQTSNPIGEVIRIKNIPFEVVGVLEAKGADIGGNDQDDIILMPYTTVRKRLQGSSFNNIDIILTSARSSSQMPLAESEIRNLLLDRHEIPIGKRADFEVQNTTEIAGVFSMITGAITLMLSTIAGISLVVGGVGIMNIMLVSVTERTREIGVRMAVGARPIDILLQFLVESIVLSLFGGVIGILLGIGASIGLTTLVNTLSSGRDWPLIVSLFAAFMALAFSAVVGIGFGFYPAWRASRLDPIDALRYE
jgi:putative ABC transport system permease protein